MIKDYILQKLSLSIFKITNDVSDKTNPEVGL